MCRRPSVSRGEFVDVVELRSEIRPVRSVVLNAPTQAGELQIVRLVKNGAKVNAGDVVVEFDDTSLRRQETDRKAELKQRDAELEQWRAQARMAEEASTTNLMRAQFDVNRAKLDVVDRDFVARMDLELARLTLSDAEQRLIEAEKRQVSDKAAQASEGARRTRRRDRTQQELERTQGVIASLKVRAPSAGTVEPHGQRAVRADDGQPPGLPRGRPGVAGRGDCGTARPHVRASDRAPRRGGPRTGRVRAVGHRASRRRARQGLRLESVEDLDPRSGGFLDELAADARLRPPARHERS